MTEKGIFDDIEEAAEAEAGSGPNYGVIILALGVIIILAVVALKMAGPGELPIIGEYPSEINPTIDGEEYFSHHFFMGLIGGIVVAGIGGVLAMRGKPVADYEEYEEEDVLAGEEEEEGICPTCGAVIPITSIECPECGEELEPMEDEELPMEEEETFEDEPVGDTIECPICAAIVDSTTSECPECGEPLGEDKGDDDDFFADL